jgi:hypothetical protein
MVGGDVGEWWVLVACQVCIQYLLQLLALVVDLRGDCGDGTVMLADH